MSTMETETLQYLAIRYTRTLAIQENGAQDFLFVFLISRS